MNKTIKSTVLSVLFFFSAFTGTSSLFAEKQKTPSASSEIIGDEQGKVDALLSTMQRRLELSHEIAKIKWNQSAPIMDRGEDESIMNQCMAKCAFYGLNPDSVQGAIKGQIEAGTTVQMNDFEKWSAEEVNTHPLHGKTLKELQMEMEKVTDQLLTELKVLKPYMDTTYFDTLLKERAAIILKGDGVDAQVRSEAIDPLLHTPSVQR